MKNILVLILLLLVGTFLYWVWGKFDGLDSILEFIKEWKFLGYTILGFFSFGGSLVWTAAAGLAAYFGVMNLWIALIVGILCNYLGDIFLFYLGKYQRNEVMPYFAKHKRKLALATLILKKYGVWAIFIQKFLYGIKTLVPISMALSRYDFKKFGFYNIFASILFVSVVMVGSYYAGDIVRKLLEVTKDNGWIVPLMLVFLIGSSWLWMESATKKR